MPDTKRRILDAAEGLFADRGFRGTSLREITASADVNLAAVNYHFGSKKELLEAVIKRRILPLNQERRKRIEEVAKLARANSERPDIRDVLTAFIEPTLSFRDAHPEAEKFFTLIGRSFTDPDDTVRRMFLRFIKPLLQLLFETSCDALPEYPRSLVFWRLHFSIGALFHSLQMSAGIREFMNMKMDVDARLLIDMIIPYVTAGMTAQQL